jgi:superfamily I DNA/RNA helicase
MKHKTVPQNNFICRYTFANAQNLFVVGDPDQTIYEWRGAKPELLVNFDKKYPNTQTVIMNQNYRSTLTS